MGSFGPSALGMTARNHRLRALESLGARRAPSSSPSRWPRAPPGRRSPRCHHPRRRCLPRPGDARWTLPWPTSMRSSCARPHASFRPPRRRSTPARRGAPPGHRGTRSRSSSRCPGSRAPRSARARSSSGDRPRPTRASTSTASRSRRSTTGGRLRSTINPDFVQSIDLAPGAFGAAYGRAIGGLVRVETAGLRDGVHGDVAADTLDASAFTSATLGRQRARRRLGPRELPRSRALPRRRARRGRSTSRSRATATTRRRREIDLRDGERLDVVFLGSNDELTENLPVARSRERPEPAHRVQLLPPLPPLPPAARRRRARRGHPLRRLRHERASTTRFGANPRACRTRRGGTAFAPRTRAASRAS